MKPAKSARKSSSESETSATAAATRESRAERLVAEYLRTWGLRDPRMIALLARHWVELAAADLSREKNCSVTQLYRAVMRRAIDDMDEWLEHLTGEVARGRRYARRGMLAIELQTVIDHCPSALLGYTSLPPAVRQRLASAALPVVPPATPTRMPVQSLEPITLNYLSRGRQLWNRLCQRVGVVPSVEASRSA